MDELEIFMYFITRGLYLDALEIGNYTTFSLVGFCDDLDRYYNYKAGLVKDGEKPRFKIPLYIRVLINRIEELRKHGYTTICSFILSLSGETHTKIYESIKEILKKALLDGNVHYSTMTIPQPQTGLTIAVEPLDPVGTKAKLVDYCHLKKYQMKYVRWIHLILGSIGDDYKILDYDIFDGEWVYDNVMEKKLDIFKKRKVEDAKRTRRKIGRNELCPCNSGLKYKKCCGKQIQG
jgi:hypothetical protein